jgi:hypothetical protein
VSLAFTSYPSGRLYLVGVDDQKRVSFNERYLARAIALWGNQQRLQCEVSTDYLVTTDPLVPASVLRSQAVLALPVSELG